MKKLDNNILAFLVLVRAGLWETEVKLLPYGQIDFKTVYKLAKEQSVVGLVTAGIERVADGKAPKFSVKCCWRDPAIRAKEQGYECLHRDAYKKTAREKH